MSATLPKQWLDRATEDLAVARLVQKAGYTASACFHSQQCIEKSLKAFLIAKINSYPYIHTLPDLLKLCNAEDSSFAPLLAEVRVVDQYYISTRYPPGIPGGLMAGAPGPAEGEEAIATAEKILTFVQERVSAM